MDNDLQTLIGRLLAWQFVAREDPLVRRALADETFYQELLRTLAACGLELIDNPFADHVALRLRRELEQPVFATDSAWLSNNLGLTRDQISLLVILWALLILPKRSRQLTRQTDEQAAVQGEMFTAGKPRPTAEQLNISVAEATLQADFAAQLGGKTRIEIGLGVLRRLRFILRRGGHIYEGPLLDLALDYERMAPRVLDGALRDLLAKDFSSGAATRDSENV